MKRHWVYALAALVTFPCLAQAQSDVGWGPQFRLTPFAGISPGIKQNGEALVYAGTSVSNHPYRVELSSALPLGVNFEYRFWNRFSVVGEGVWAQRTDGRLIDYEDEAIYNDFDGSTFWMAKLGAGMRLREVNPDMQLKHLNALLFIAPALITDDPRVSLTTPQTATGTVTNWGLNVGAEAELPLANNRLAFQVGLEDWIIYWDETNYAPRIQAYLQETNPAIDAVLLNADKTQFFILRVGLTFRF